MMRSVFAEWAPRYRERGFWPRPTTSGTKACHVEDWTNSEATLHPDDHYAKHGIGLLLGSPITGGFKLGAIDIDHDDYVRLGEALFGPTICGRIGKKGIAIFVRIQGNPKSRALIREDNEIQLVDCLFEKRLCVIPPTIHPDTGKPYEWIGTPLLEVDLNQLPIIGA